MKYVAVPLIVSLSKMSRCTLRLFKCVKHTLIRSYMLEILVEHSLKVHWQSFAKLRSRCTHENAHMIEMHLHFHSGCYKNNFTRIAQFCRSIDLLWLIWDVCLVLEACCDLLRLLKNKGQETPSQHKGWNKKHHLHIQPLFFSCLWAKLAIRGSEAKVINSTVLYKLT